MNTEHLLAKLIVIARGDVNLVTRALREPSVEAMVDYIEANRK